jgi:hypothetical protein
VVPGAGHHLPLVFSEGEDVIHVVVEFGLEITEVLGLVVRVVQLGFKRRLSLQLAVVLVLLLSGDGFSLVVPFGFLSVLVSWDGLH